MGGVEFAASGCCCSFLFGCGGWSVKGRMWGGDVSATFVLHVFVCKENANFGCWSVNGGELENVEEADAAVV